MKGTRESWQRKALETADLLKKAKTEIELLKSELRSAKSFLNGDTHFDEVRDPETDQLTITGKRLIIIKSSKMIDPVAMKQFHGNLRQMAVEDIRKDLDRASKQLQTG